MCGRSVQRSPKNDREQNETYQFLWNGWLANHLAVCFWIVGGQIPVIQFQNIMCAQFLYEQKSGRLPKRGHLLGINFSSTTGGNSLSIEAWFFTIRRIQLMKVACYRVFPGNYALDPCFFFGFVSLNKSGVRGSEIFEEFEDVDLPDVPRMWEKKVYLYLADLSGTYK